MPQKKLVYVFCIIKLNPQLSLSNEIIFEKKIKNIDPGLPDQEINQVKNQIPTILSLQSQFHKFDLFSVRSLEAMGL